MMMNGISLMGYPRELGWNRQRIFSGESNLSMNVRNSTVIHLSYVLDE